MRYRLTVDFTSEDSVTTWDFPNAEDDKAFLKIALEDVKAGRLKSFRLDRLDERGKRIKTPKCFTVAELSLKEQADILKAQA